MPGLERQLRWLIGIRLVVITSVVLPYFFLQLTGSPAVTPLTQPSTPAATAPLPAPLPTLGREAAAAEPLVDSGFLYFLAFVTYLASLVYILLLRILRGRGEIQAYIQFFGDLLLITALIYYFGGVSNPFSLLYLIVIAVASTLLRRQAGFTVATGAYCLYATIVLGLFFHWLPELPGREPVSPESLFVLTYNLAVHLFGFYAVAVLTYLLAHRVTRAELELEEKREDLADLQVVHRDVIESISSGLITTDLAGVVTSVNRAGQEILAMSESQLLGRRIFEIDFLSADQWEDLTAGTAWRLGERRTEVELEHDGETVYIGFSVSRLTDAEGTSQGSIVIFQDFTRWRRLEEELRIKDRMAAVGELAAGLAHEIGNPLAAISGSVQLLAHGGADPERRKLLDILFNESQRLDRTIKGFLRFARPRERTTSWFDIAALLAENFALLENSQEVSPRHQLRLDLVPPSASLVADPDQISQIFWNLARNALRAMPGGGTLTVRGRLGDGIYDIEVSDSGSGMTPEQTANLFHPFHSFFDSGTGIGMAIVYRIVQEHRGRVAVDSRPGVGTTVRVTLPKDDTVVLAAGIGAP